MELIWTLGSIIVILFGLLVEAAVAAFIVVKMMNGETKAKVINWIYDVIFYIGTEII